MPGTLYLCATPIGNLEDISLRAIRILKEVDLIAAEDTRNSRKLLAHYDIHTPVTSYHEHNKWDKARFLISRLKEGADIALITDAGMPCVSDPGECVVKMAHDEGIAVSVIPGASASLSALAVSGLDTSRFVFEGFLPASGKERRDRLSDLRSEERTIILYEAPHRLLRTLRDLMDCLGSSRPATLVRELTKKHETVKRADLGTILDMFGEDAPKGECVLILSGRSRSEKEIEDRRQWEDLSVQDHYALYLGQGMDRKEAVKQVAEDRGITRRDVYGMLFQEET